MPPVESKTRNAFWQPLRYCVAEAILLLRVASTMILAIPVCDEPRILIVKVN
jgi:hypothetical protein